MRSFELRVYTLRSKKALEFYENTVYPRHLGSFPKFGVECHGFWTAKAEDEPRLFVLVSYADGEDPGEITQRYMQSADFAEDVRDFEVADIVNVETTALVPSRSSTLQ